MKKIAYLLSGVLALLFVQACDNMPGKNFNKPTIDQDGVYFVRNGIEASVTEIKASGLAITNSNNQRVIALAKMMIEDNTKTIGDLKMMGASKHVSEQDTMTTAHRETISSLSKISNRVFDKAYIQMMVADHEQAVKLFSAATINADADVKRTAAKTLPLIQMHLDLAKAVLTGL